MHKQHHTPWQLFFFLAATVGVLMMSDTLSWSGSVRDLLERSMLLLRPKLSANDRQERAQLMAKIAGLTIELQKAQEENVQLRKELESPLPPSFRFIFADVVSRQFDTEDTSLLIRVGRREGVKSGMPVLVERALVGVITKTTPHLSTVRLLTSTESKITVKTVQGTSGLLIGKKTEHDGAAGSVLLDKILQAETIVSDEAVVTSGDEFMPPNILIGTVGTVISEPRDPFKQAQVQLTVDPSDIISVFVVNEE